MINYLNPNEKNALFHYTNVLNNTAIEHILQNDGIRSTEDARELASFFWKLVDQTVIDSKSDVIVAGYTNLESLCEDLMQTLRSHFIAAGYMEIWEEESDNAE